MNANESKCSCQNCSEHIVFESQYAGQMADCPHCGMETRLFIPPVQKPPVRKPDNVMPYITGGNSPDENLVLIGWICAILFPIIGIIIGAVLNNKKNDRGMLIMVCSVIAMVVWIAILSGFGS